MSRLVNLADGVYEELTRLKKAKDASYSEIVAELLEGRRAVKKTHGWAETIAWARERGKKFRGKRERTDHDLIAYGVSRDSA